MYPQFLGLTRRTLLSSNPFVPAEIIPNSLVQRPTRRSNQQSMHQRYGFPSDNNTELWMLLIMFNSHGHSCCVKKSIRISFRFISHQNPDELLSRRKKSSSHLIIKDERSFFYVHTREDKFVKHKVLRRGFVVK